MRFFSEGAFAAGAQANGLSANVIQASRIINQDGVATWNAVGPGSLGFATTAGVNFTAQEIRTTAASALDLIPVGDLVSAGAAATAGLALFPSRCKVCRAWLEAPGSRVVCGDCLSGLTPEPSPICPCCGTFFDAAGEPHYCGACLETPPPFSVHRSLGRYRGALKDVILLFKFRGEAEAGEAEKRWDGSGWRGQS